MSECHKTAYEAHACDVTSMSKKEKKNYTFIPTNLLLIAHSSGEFNDKNVPNHRLYTAEKDKRSNRSYRIREQIKIQVWRGTRLSTPPWSVLMPI